MSKQEFEYRIQSISATYNPSAVPLIPPGEGFRFREMHYAPQGSASSYGHNSMGSHSQLITKSETMSGMFVVVWERYIGD